MKLVGLPSSKTEIRSSNIDKNGHPGGCPFLMFWFEHAVAPQCAEYRCGERRFVQSSGDDRPILTPAVKESRPSGQVLEAVKKEP